MSGRALSELLARDTKGQPPTPSSPAPVPAKDFWKEFLRVNFDKLLLLGLGVFLWRVGQMDTMKFVIGGLVGAVTHNRFQRNP